jgi:hypothetical protein
MVFGGRRIKQLPIIYQTKLRREKKPQIEKRKKMSFNYYVFVRGVINNTDSSKKKRAEKFPPAQSSVPSSERRFFHSLVNIFARICFPAVECYASNFPSARSSNWAQKSALKIEKAGNRLFFPFHTILNGGTQKKSCFDCLAWKKV